MKIHLLDEKGLPVDLKNEDRSKPWVFVFSGRALSPEALNGDMDALKKNVDAAIQGMKRRLQYVGADVSDCRFFGAYYDKNERKHILDYNEKGTIDSGVQELADEIIENRVCTNGKLHKPRQAMAEMDGVLFFGHCFGGMVVSSLEKGMQKSLERKGAEIQAQKEILSAPKAILTNPMLKVDKMPEFMDTFAFVNCSDAMLTDVPEYKSVRESLLRYSGFQDDQLFLYDRNVEKWKYPQSNDKAYLKIKGAQNLRVLFASSLDTPPREVIDAKIRSEMNLPQEEAKRRKVSPEYFEKYIELQNRYAGGHELRCLIRPLNNSPFLNELRNYYLYFCGEQFKKAKDAQERANLLLNRLSSKRQKQK